jgi:hypothetical protein
MFRAAYWATFRASPSGPAPTAGSRIDAIGRVSVPSFPNEPRVAVASAAYDDWRVGSIRLLARVISMSGYPSAIPDGWEVRGAPSAINLF